MLRYYKIIICTILSFLYTGFSISLKAQSLSEDKIVIRVQDKNGMPVQNVFIKINNKKDIFKTDINGLCNINVSLSDTLSLKALGFIPAKCVVKNAKNNLITLDRYAENLTDNNINVPFGSIGKRKFTEQITILGEKDIERYPTNDLRNALVGLLPGYYNLELEGSSGVNAYEKYGNYLGSKTKVTETCRNSNLTYIIDDMLFDITQMPLDPQEIESISLLKDPYTKSLYGPFASDGVVYIKTKRGENKKNKISIDIERGVSFVDRIPKYVGGGDYARLNNLARKNSNRDTLYTEEAIGNYDKNNQYDLFYPSNNYRSLLLKNQKEYSRLNVSARGGNDRTQYFVYLGYSGETDIMNFGPTSDYNRFNVRTNLDIKLNNFISLKTDVVGNLSITKSPCYTSAGTAHVFDNLIQNINTISPIAMPIFAKYDPENMIKWYAVASNFGTNPVAALGESGHFKEKNRQGAGKASLILDLNQWVKGLTSTSSIGYNTFNVNRIGISESYDKYMIEPNYYTFDYELVRKGEKSVATSQSNFGSFGKIISTAYENLNYNNSFGQHDIDANLLFITSNDWRFAKKDPNRQYNSIASVNYSFKNRYILQSSVSYVGLPYYEKGDRYKFLPTFGAAWVISDEKLLKKCRFIDFLKIRAQYGKVASTAFQSYFSYDDNWTSSATNNFGKVSNTGDNWFGNNSGVSYSTSYNRSPYSSFGWESRKEFSTGIEMSILKNRLYFDMEYYNKTRDGIITSVGTYPSFLGLTANPLINYNKQRYTGFDFILKYSDFIGTDFKYSLQGMATIQKGRNLKVGEVKHKDSYRDSEGKPTDAIWGYEYLGKFATDEEAQNSIQTFSSNLVAGDLKYADKNNDGIINDDDVCVIGNSTPKLFYSFGINLKYKNWELYMLCNGRAFCDIMLSNNYYRNGSGDSNYSVWVRDNIGGEYPRLTYDNISNNFQSSAYWLRDGSYLKLQNAELSYTMFLKKKPSSIKFFARGANLLTISKIKDTDPESMDSGVSRYPLFRTVVGGIKLTF